MSAVFFNPASRLGAPPPITGSSTHQSPQVGVQGRLWVPDRLDDGIGLGISHRLSGAPPDRSKAQGRCSSKDDELQLPILRELSE